VQIQSFHKDEGGLLFLKYYFQQKASEHFPFLITSTAFRATEEQFELSCTGYEVSKPDN